MQETPRFMKITLYGTMAIGFDFYPLNITEEYGNVTTQTVTPCLSAFLQGLLAHGIVGYSNIKYQELSAKIFKAIKENKGTDLSYKIIAKGDYETGLPNKYTKITISMRRGA